MLQVDKKALFIDYVNGYNVIKSYATPIIFTHNSKVYTTDTKYSTTTSKHKNFMLKYYQGRQIIVISQKAFNQVMSDNGVSLGIA
jgi:hypothetical protein